MEDLRLLRVLCEVARRRSFSAAAAALSYSQPAVSQQVARLERQLGVQLVEREPGGVVVTPAGTIVVRYAERMLGEAAAARAELAALLGAEGHGVAIGAYPSAAGTIVPTALACFRERAPTLDAELVVAEPPELIDRLRAGTLDLVLSDDGGFCGPLDVGGLVAEALLDDPLHAVLPRTHALAAGDAIRLAQLRQDDFLLLGLPGAETHENLVLRACRAAGFEPRVVLSSLEFLVLGGMVASGRGVALMPGLALGALPPEVAVRPLAGPPPARRVSMLTREADPGPAVRAMIDCLRAAADELGSISVRDAGHADARFEPVATAVTLELRPL